MIPFNLQAAVKDHLDNHSALIGWAGSSLSCCLAVLAVVIVGVAHDVVLMNCFAVVVHDDVIIVAVHGLF